MITPEKRQRLLREKLEEKGFVRIIEAHSGISALIGESACFQSENGLVQYDGFWESKVTDSDSKGFSDVEVVGLDSRVNTVNEILEASTQPIIVDGDRGMAGSFDANSLICEIPASTLYISEAPTFIYEQQK